MTPVPKEYMVICAQAVTAGPSPDFFIEYHCDKVRFSDRKAAITHGFAIRESDDFNIAVVRGDHLISFDWMDEPTGEDVDSLGEIAKQLGLKA